MTQCPNCGHRVKEYNNPLPTVDIVIETGGGIVLIERKNFPFGWALPGGFVDYGESLETAAMREAFEETGLRVTLKKQLGSYSDPNRDPRFHTVTTVFIAEANGQPIGRDDAKQAKIFTENQLPDLAFDHKHILDDYFKVKSCCF